MDSVRARIEKFFGRRKDSLRGVVADSDDPDGSVLVFGDKDVAKAVQRFYPNLTVIHKGWDDLVEMPVRMSTRYAREYGFHDGLVVIAGFG